jgi:hypothetical protein
MDPHLTYRAVPVTPRELIGPTPRKAHLFGDGVKFGIIAVSLLALVAVSGLWFCADAIRQIQQRAVLQREGREVVGEITRQRSGSRISVPSVSYTFTVNGTAFSGWAQMPQNLAGSLRESDHILVRFLPANPAINHPDAWAWSVLLNLDWIAVQILFAIIGSVVMVILSRERRLASEGRPSVGVVATCAPKDRTFWVKYDFSTEDGRSIKGSGYCWSRQEIGASICVLYLPQNPRRNRPYPLPNFRVEAGSTPFK